MREARGSCDELKERAEREESLVTLDELKQIHTDANKMVVREKQALTEDRDQFVSDMDRIGEYSILMVTYSVSHNPVFIDKLLSELVVVMDQSDVEYAEVMRELKREIFYNRCRQERLEEHLWRLEKNKQELERPKAEENRTSAELEEELCGNANHQEKLREQLQGLEKRLKVVQATASVEEFLQDKGNEVSHGLIVMNLQCMFIVAANGLETSGTVWYSLLLLSLVLHRKC